MDSGTVWYRISHGISRNIGIMTHAIDGFRKVVQNNDGTVPEKLVALAWK